MKHLIVVIGGLLMIQAAVYGQEMKSHKHHADSANAGHKAAAKAEQYVCPMHSEVISDKPGKCPTCKMDLVKKVVVKPASAKSTFTCPMHPEVKSDKPGKCPKCKMTLVREKKNK